MLIARPPAPAIGRTRRGLTIGTCTCLLISLHIANGLGQTGADDLPDRIDALHALLRSDAPRLKKIEACKQLGALGGSDSVPVLAELLSDPDLSHAARIGLESIPASAAADALRAAVPQLKGKLLVGVINSLGARRDAASVRLLPEQIRSSDREVARAAAFALGRIATDDAVDVLLENLPSTAAPVRDAIGQGCLIAADICRREERMDTARRIGQALVAAPLEPHLRRAAVRSVLMSSATVEPDRLQQLIESKDPQDFDMALTVIRELPDQSISRLVAKMLDQVPLGRQALLVMAVADRGDAQALNVVMAGSRSPHEQVRSAATRCLANFRFADTGARLLEMVCDPQEPAATAARDAIVRMADPAADQAVLDRLEDSDVSTRLVLYDLIGARHIAAGLPALLQGADAADAAERVAAIQALGKTIPARQLNVLTNRLAADTPPKEFEAVKNALLASCIRLGDAETCAQEIAACLPQTSGSLHYQLYDLLGLVGGETALQVVAEAAKDMDPQMQDTITRVLGQWMTPDAAPLLLQIAQSKVESKYRIRALRGYIRILRQFDMSNRQRIDMCRKAMPLAQRKEERLLMLEALLRVSSRDTLALAVTQLESDAVRHRACEVTLLLSNALAERQPDAVIAAMDKVIAVTKDAAFKNYARQLRARAERKKGQQ